LFLLSTVLLRSGIPGQPRSRSNAATGKWLEMAGQKS